MQLRVVVHRDGEFFAGLPMTLDSKRSWVAECLEYDLATQAESLEYLLFYELPRLITAHVICCRQEGLDPWAIIPAPPETHDLWDQSPLKMLIDVDEILRAWHLDGN
jgi:hypothetical protein